VRYCSGHPPGFPRQDVADHPVAVGAAEFEYVTLGEIDIVAPTIRATGFWRGSGGFAPSLPRCRETCRLLDAQLHDRTQHKHNAKDFGQLARAIALSGESESLRDHGINIDLNVSSTKELRSAGALPGADVRSIR